MQNKKTNVWCLQELTQHRSFTTASGSTTCMLGDDCNDNVEEVVRALKNNQETDAKEKHPILCLGASPRQGKSLFLEVFSERVQGADQFAVWISYNSKTQACEADMNPKSMASRFWARMIHAVDNADQEEDRMGCV